MRWGFWKWWTRRSSNDFAAEIESHIAMEVERLMRAGMSAEEAQFAARRAFGNTTAAREHFREHRPGWTMESIGQDVRYLSLIHISEPTRLLSISYAVFC